MPELTFPGLNSFSYKSYLLIFYENCETENENGSVGLPHALLPRFTYNFHNEINFESRSINFLRCGLRQLMECWSPHLEVVCYLIRLRAYVCEFQHLFMYSQSIDNSAHSVLSPTLQCQLLYYIVSYLLLTNTCLLSKIRLHPSLKYTLTLSKFSILSINITVQYQHSVTHSPT